MIKHTKAFRYAKKENMTFIVPFKNGIDAETFEYRNTFAVRKIARYYDDEKKYHKIGTIICFSMKNPYFDEYDYTIGEDFEYYSNIKKYIKNPRDYLNEIQDVIWRKYILGDKIEYDFGNFDAEQLDDLPRIIDLLRSLDYSIAIHYSNKNILNEMTFDIGKLGSINLNIQAFVGSNGVGKTTLMRNMVQSTIRSSSIRGKISFVGFPLKKTIAFLMNSLDKPIIENNSSKIKYVEIRDDYFYKPEYSGINYGVGDENGPSETEISRINRNKTFETICNFDIKKQKVFKKVLSLFSNDCFFGMGKIINEKYDSKIEKNAYNEFFSSLGNGHKKIIITIVAFLKEIEFNSLVFMDEPEANLYPGLITLYLKSLKLILDEFSSIMFVYTHSPVLIQQLPKKSVWKISRVQEFLKIENIWFNSMGENLGRITREIFDIDIEDSLYYSYMMDTNIDSSLFNEFGDEAKSIILARRLRNE